ncbi:hypothetical protein CP967_04390 [Streptomyces nitrosporeus]|uniref:Uncharacterized protein n=2 Tax=Streptomyces nitrosporeus TaxID=28894 RepID=A0A5J6F8K8_9ACTN|nr:hypothetical protein [Streptomyces nitrosporeus]QEU71295.1 hypothetical protein CP967_04390 [Streptomyces nitrosporeus]GGY99022.1 hypothetical protein GCM10010327_32050 [Streptomyces nitrosporeus]
MSSPSVFAEATEALAAGVLGAFDGTEDAVRPARYVDDSSDPLAALAAIRVLGADVLAPHLLAGRPFLAEDAAVMAKAFDAFPAADSTEEATVAWRDWAAAQLLSVAAKDPAPHRPAPAAGTVTDSTDWRPWSVRMSQLAPLATTGLDGPVHDAARTGALPLSRGVTRSLLRRDFPTAARLVRWLAWLRYEGVELPLDPALAAEHIWLVGGAGPRTALDLVIARHLLGARPGTGEKAERT